MKPYYLIGEHLGHSFSAEIHIAFGRYDYELKELAPAELENFLRARDFAGLNVTIPYKEAVIPFLDHLDPVAAAIGAVNTVVNRDGVLWGYNTDFGGMKAALARAGIAVKGKSVFVLGTGGTSKTALAVCRALGAGELFRVSRTGHAGALSYHELYALFEGPPHPSAPAALPPSPQGEGFGAAAASGAVLINCTPVGMWPDLDGLPLDLKALRFCHAESPKGPASRRSEESAPSGLGERIATTSVRTGLAMTGTFPARHSERCEESASSEKRPLSTVHCPLSTGDPAVLDCVYNPLRTRLVLEARHLGLPAMGGLYMLVQQAALACELFTGAPVEMELVDIICNSLRRKQENIVLIGMPGAGKSTVSRILAQKTGREFVDIDEAVEKLAGKPISAIFAGDGEAAFRDLECSVVRKAAAAGGQIIASGGGTILRAENLRRLQQTGRLVLLDRPPEALEPSPERPLGDTREKLAALYAERYARYLQAADLRIDNPGSPEEAAEIILSMTL